MTGLVDSSWLHRRFGTENVRSQTPFERNFWPFQKRTSLKKVRTKFRNFVVPKSVVQSSLLQERPDTQISSFWYIWTPNVRNFVLTFFKLDLFWNGQKFLSKGVWERTFSVPNRRLSQDESTKPLIPLQEPGQKRRIMHCEICENYILFELYYINIENFVPRQ